MASFIRTYWPGQPERGFQIKKWQNSTISKDCLHKNHQKSSLSKIHWVFTFQQADIKLIITVAQQNTRKSQTLMNGRWQNDDSHCYPTCD